MIQFNFIDCKRVASVGFSIVLFLITLSLYSADDTYVPSARHEESLPLVLGIPGFRVPGVNLTQEEHFGNLGTILSDMGIPYYCLTYDSDEYPLAKVADLASKKYSIAATRVAPSIVRVIKLEQERRLKENLPPVKDVTMFMYSQGTVVSYGFVRLRHYFLRKFKNFHDMFGIEIEALFADPAFKSFIYALDTYTLIKSIQVQREKDFRNDPDLRFFMERSTQELNRLYKEIQDYIVDPKTLYPNVEHFEPPETDKYPKQYTFLKKYMEKCLENPDLNKTLMDFLKEYSLLGEVKDINFMYFSVSGSIFGSPHANAGYDLLNSLAIFKSAVKGINQIKDTRVGSFHHTKKIRSLVRESKLPNYPINKTNSLFVVGVNGEQGDNLVDQPSAHLSGHGYVVFDLLNDEFGEDGISHKKMEVLPELHVVPLDVRHFPVHTLWGLGPTIRGSAYIDTREHPVLKYLIPFVYKDFDRIEQLKQGNKNYLRQFMIEFTFTHITGGAQTDQQLDERRKKLFLPGSKLLENILGDLKVKVVRRPFDIELQDRIFNAENLTYVIVGAYEESILSSDPPETETMGFRIAARGFEPVNITLPVKPGKILFVNITLQESQ